MPRYTAKETDRRYKRYCKIMGFEYGSVLWFDDGEDLDKLEERIRFKEMAKLNSEEQKIFAGWLNVQSQSYREWFWTQNVSERESIARSVVEMEKKDRKKPPHSVADEIAEAVKRAQENGRKTGNYSTDPGPSFYGAGAQEQWQTYSFGGRSAGKSQTQGFDFGNFRNQAEEKSSEAGVLDWLPSAPTTHGTLIFVHQQDWSRPFLLGLRNSTAEEISTVLEREVKKLADELTRSALDRVAGLKFEEVVRLALVDSQRPDMRVGLTMLIFTKAAEPRPKVEAEVVFEAVDCSTDRSKLLLSLVSESRSQVADTAPLGSLRENSPVSSAEWPMQSLREVQEQATQPPQPHPRSTSRRSATRHSRRHKE